MNQNARTNATEKEGLLSAVDLLKYTLTLATGSLVFSAGLVAEDVQLPLAARVTLVCAWILLVLSVVTGVMAFSRIPILITEAKYDLEDRLLVIPWRIHHVAFGLAIISLAATLVAGLIGKQV